MTSTGNDIIAIKATNRERTIHPQFYSKILSVAEHALYHSHQVKGIPFEKFVWLSWSIKESVYKYIKRTVPGLAFSPTRIIIRGIVSPDREYFPMVNSYHWENINSDPAGYFYQGKIFYENNIFYSRSAITDEIIASVVSQNEEFRNSCWGIKTIEHSGYNSQSKAVRAFVLNRLNTLSPDATTPFEIGMTPEGCPVVLSGTREINIPVSLAHHDRYIAYSFFHN